MVNPYDPQNPIRPDYFGGRKRILTKVEERIEKALIERQSGGILIYGYRGVGKTSLLKKIVSIYSGNGQELHNNIIVISKALGKSTTDTDLYSMLIENLREKIRERQTLWNRLVDSGKKLDAVKILNVEIDTRNVEEKVSPGYLFFSLLKNVRNADCIVIEIDDADYLTKEAISELKSIVESQNPVAPVILVASGGIEFEERLVTDYSPIARIFSGASFDLGEFTRDETVEVLTNPLSGRDTKWDDSGIDKVQELSGGYPYLVQCMASACYSEHAVIDAERVKQNVQNALSIGKAWLSHEIPNASDNDIKSFLRIADLHKSAFTSSEIGEAGVAPPYVGRLVGLGVLRKVNRGRYKLNKAPIIAYYHALERQIITGN